MARASQPRVALRTSLTVLVLSAVGIQFAVLAGPSGATTPVEYLVGVGCASPSACQAVGLVSPGSTEIIGTLDGGARWKNESPPEGVKVSDTGVSSYISCPTPSICFAVGSHLMHTSNAGRTWSTVTQLPPALRSKSLVGISCPSKTTCQVIFWGGHVARTSDGGRSWTTETLPPTFKTSGVFGLSCGSVSRCVIVGQEVVETSNGGRSWAPASIPSSIFNLGSVSCGSATSCLALGDDQSGRIVALSTSNFGVAWTQEGVPRAASSYASVSCGSGNSCQGLFYTRTGATLVAGTIDSGRNWTVERVPVTHGGVNDVACPSSQVCVGVGAANGANVAIRTSNGGKSWTKQTL